MALTLPTATRNSQVDNLTSLFDAGGAGSLVVGTAGMAADLCTITLNVDSFEAAGTSAPGVARSLAIVNGVCTGVGTAGAAVIKNNAGTIVVDGLTVAVAAANINLTNLGLAVNDQISFALNSIVITQPAS